MPGSPGHHPLPGLEPWVQGSRRDFVEYQTAHFVARFIGFSKKDKTFGVLGFERIMWFSSVFQGFRGSRWWTLLYFLAGF